MLLVYAVVLLPRLLVVTVAVVAVVVVAVVVVVDGDRRVGRRAQGVRRECERGGLLSRNVERDAAW